MIICKGERPMCKLIIEQGYNKVEFETQLPTEAGILIETLQPYVKKDTKFTIEYVKEKENEQ